MKQFLLGAVFGVTATAAGALSLAVAHAAGDLSTYRTLDLFAQAFDDVRRNYIQPIDDMTIVDGAVHGMLSALDPHSSYMNAEEYAEGIQYTKNTGAGPGFRITKFDGLTRILGPEAGSPAARNGIRAGDYLVAIDGKPVDRAPADSVEMMLRGAEGSKITLTVAHGRRDETFDAVLERARYRAATVTYERKGNVGYIRIASLIQGAGTSTERAVADLKKQIGPGLKGYVLDLRDNPGGLLDESVTLSDLFLDSGCISETRGRAQSDNMSYRAKPGDIADAKPLVILVNEGTASGAEIIAGAFRDNHRAKLVGTKTAGAGTIQTIIPLADGKSGALRLTTAKFLTPSGQPIEDAGLAPDVSVSGNGAGDPQLDAALDFLKRS